MTGSSDSSGGEPPLPLKINEELIFSEIERVRAKRVLFSCPDGYLKRVSEIASHLEDEKGVEVILSADPCYGICDMPDEDAGRLGVDIAFHIGHSSTLKKYGRRTVLVDGYDDVDFSGIVEDVVPTLRRYPRVGLCTISQHLHQLAAVKGLLEERGFEVQVGGGHDLLRDGQIFGCRFHTVFTVRDRVDAFLLLGQSRFHALGVALSTGRPTFMLDPYFQRVEDVSGLAEKWLRKAVLQVYRARDAERFGIIIGVREGQMMREKALLLKRRLLEHGRGVHMIALREVKDDRLAAFQNIDAFIQTACPRISIDGEEFSRPVLSVPQAEALLEVLDGREPKTFLERSHWL